MKKIMLISLLFLIGCAGSPELAGKQGSVLVDTTVEGSTCEGLSRELLKMNKKNQSEVIDKLVHQTIENPGFDSNLVSRCLDQRLTISCSHQDCLVALKEVQK